MTAWLAVAASVAWSAWLARVYWLARVQMQRDRMLEHEQMLDTLARSERRAELYRQRLHELSGRR